MSLTPEDIKDLRRKLSEATPGIWIDMGDTEPWPGTVIATTVPDGGVTPVCIDPEADDRPADRACIAALRNAAPALLDAADELALLRASLTVPERYVGVVTEAVAEELERVKAERDEMAAAGRTVVEAAEEGWADIEAQLQAKIEELDEHRRYTATVEADLAALRLEHESWGAIIDGLRASLATVTRERDEARKALATEEHNHELTIARRDDAQSWADSLANQIAEAADHEIGEHSNLNNPWDNAQDGLVKLVRERDELRAALTSERVAVATMVDHIIDRKGWLPESAPEPMQTMQRHYEMTCKAAGDNGNTIEDLARAIGINPDADDLVAEARKRIAALAGAKS